MTETATPEALVASLTAALDAEEAVAEAATPGPWRSHDTHLPNGAGHTATVLSGEGNATDLRAWLPTMSSKPWDKTRNAWNDADFIARQDPARTLRQVAAHREILDRYAETLRDYARSLERARGGPIGNADLDDFEAELPVLRSIVEIIAGIYEEPQQ